MGIIGPLFVKSHSTVKILQLVGEKKDHYSDQRYVLIPAIKTILRLFIVVARKFDGSWHNNRTNNSVDDHPQLRHFYEDNYVVYAI